MLVLCRRTGETLIIGDEVTTQVTMTVLGVKGNQVRIGFKAPKEIPINREEVYERIQKRMQSLTEPDLPSTSP